ncbi:hypothetical protein E5F05_07645 [Deinococcus metallilatus]|uniref:Uncharacterized protein n=1 Tax=Deinococcus metallilatus TaxID=1211322 RepID=A0AAJ5JZ01_9DEIO|nr:hypothetical protein [Deinococcus metallilatus]MBB5297032.1 hypothetical protein [Deinococcus metallilatus]QBY07839.1 hypothetical protein E5F05_07645 [Deinococcus metallilatus]RXJ13188.1 hypothetical protein ERJ73_06470 [Deinococcus metallilatus]TLK23039.1 hypothetical protein FCS05_16845 [Deinococcus metallilatus]GMA15998.1 hypothetical protein GCM10025871_23290 [Deinococcus metallilatus]
MTPRNVRLALLLFPLIPAALLTVLAQRTKNVPSLDLVKPELSCTQPPTYRVGYQREDNGLTPQGSGFHFQGLSWLQTDLCSAGTLLVTAEGQVAAGAAPELTFMLNSKPLAVESFDRRKTLKLKIPEAGRLTIGYFNDYYFMNARVANLDGFSLAQSACRQLDIHVPKGAGGWYPEANTAVLVSEIPATLVPCGRGRLKFYVMGREARGAFPVLLFEQNGQQLLEKQTSAQREFVQLPVSRGPVTVKLTNPFVGPIVDRNLDVQKLLFIPAPPHTKS